MVNNDREWDFLYWDDTDYGDNWTDSKPKKPKTTTIED